RQAVATSDQYKIIITHGTDTMVQTGQVLNDISGKTIVLVGSLQPARFRSTDALFNIGMAVAAVQSKPDGVYITMNGHVFDVGKVKKNLELNQFQII
ncbi:MAG: asparaginase domain-containing protein, partial [Pseudomonadota bacterium]